jgi:hypothetical protein
MLSASARREDSLSRKVANAESEWNAGPTDYSMWQSALCIFIVMAGLARDNEGGSA